LLKIFCVKSFNSHFYGGQIELDRSLFWRASRLIPFDTSNFIYMFGLKEKRKIRKRRIASPHFCDGCVIVSRRDEAVEWMFDKREIPRRYLVRVSRNVSKRVCSVRSHVNISLAICWSDNRSKLDEGVVAKPGHSSNYREVAAYCVSS